ncbi:MAG: tRNA (adenine-N(6)-)-methyltransferase [Flavobacteriaceae bacterium]|jgi:tRNA1Val (adenine37-N6)-methyltransferase|nr:tRNA (adenine-N(6)-)-methyltransferase [Flavobacteriaceae bacterium]|tara:strand:+ start:17835 stop:18551 length:717 start_codon:yes stop_codon:yes gene_type:complete
MSTKPFQFKQFKVHQDRCAMKIGTDSVILGAHTSLKRKPKSVLDIGAGTGILSLMLAQRCDSDIIDAVEIDDNAFEQCTNNFEDSPWNDRLFCYHTSLEDFTAEVSDSYDLIITNPPYYSEDYKSANPQRDLARFQDALPFANLLECVSKLLHKTGTFSIIIPFEEEDELKRLALNYGLFANDILRIKGHASALLKRSIIEFSFVKSNCNLNTLVIEKKRHQYTADYIKLTKKFYLKL